MKLIYLILLMFIFTLADERRYDTGETVTLVGAGGTDVETTGDLVVKHWKGIITLMVEPTEVSGTAQIVTVTAQYKFDGFDYHGTDETIGTISVSDIQAGLTNYFDLSGLAWWKYFEVLKIKFSGASGTYNVTLETKIRGQ